MTDSEASTPASAMGAEEAILQLDTLELIPGVRVLSLRGELDVLTAPSVVKRICLEIAAGRGA